MRCIDLVTGASSGLGRDIAKLLCEKGNIVYVVARRKEKLLELKKECSKHKGQIKIIAGDLIDTKFRERLIKKVLKESGRIDHLINNAGYGTLIELEKQDISDIQKMFEVNIISYEHLVSLALPSMKRRKKGRIINTSSVAAFEPPPYFATYNATKYAVYGFSRSLSHELAGTGVSVSVVFPARMKTNFWKVAFKCYGMTGTQKNTCYAKWTKGSSGSLPVAKVIVRNLDSKRLFILPNLLSLFAFYFLRHFYFIGTLYMKYLMRPKSKKVFSGHKVKKGYKKN